MIGPVGVGAAVVEALDAVLEIESVAELVTVGRAEDAEMSEELYMYVFKRLGPPQYSWALPLQVMSH